MSAQVGMRHNPNLRSIYIRLANKGNYVKVVLTTLMRRLIILENVQLRDNRVWERHHT